MVDWPLIELEIRPSQNRGFSAIIEGIGILPKVVRRIRSPICHMSKELFGCVNA